MTRTIVLLFSVACGGGAATEPQPTTPVPLPVVAEVVDASPPVVEAEAPVEPTVTFASMWTSEPANASSQPTDIALVVDFAQIRKHPEGVRLGLVVAATPEWRSLLVPQAGLQVDMVRDFDWMRLDGPSLIDTTYDDILLHYSLADGVVDRGIDTLVHKRKGSAINLHLPPAKAWKVVVDVGESVVVRAAPHTVAVVPAARAQLRARDLVSHPPPPPPTHVDEAMRIRVPNPSTRLTWLPTDITEMRLWVDGHPGDGSADVYFEGDCPSHELARADADELRGLIQQKNSFGVRLVTNNLLTGIIVAPVGNLVRLWMHASEAQIRAILMLLASQYQVTLPP